MSEQIVFPQSPTEFDAARAEVEERRDHVAGKIRKEKRK